MKAAAFGVVRAESVDEVLAALAEHGDEARVIAGGQSLGPLMSLRLAAPEVLVDLSRVPGLDELAVSDDVVRIGAMVRQRTVEHGAAVRSAAPLVAEAIPYIGHTAIRSQGTVCGSLAHADPAAELPAVALAAGATMHIRSKAGSRTVAAADFFTGYYSTAIEDGELLEAVSFPALPARTGTAFVEFSRRHGDFALVGVAATVSLAADGAITAARLALSGVASTPWPATSAAALLLGATPDAATRPPAASAASGRTPGELRQVGGARLQPEPEASKPSPASGRTPDVVAEVDGAPPQPEAGARESIPSGRTTGGPGQVGGPALRPDAAGAGTPPASGRTLGVVGWSDAPVLRPGSGPYAEAVRAASEAVRADVDPSGDLHATAAYRRHLAAVLTARALTIALARAEEARE